MKIIKPSAEVMYPDITDPGVVDAMYQQIERAGRTCYKSEDRITAESSRKFVKKLVESRHEAMLEHASMTVKFIVDRGVSHELVRHRIASFAQESTRYCDYSKDKFGGELTFIEPCFWTDEDHDLEMKAWKEMMQAIEDLYRAFRQYEVKPEEARCILPNSLKTEVIMTANLREWKHFFRLRAAGETGKPHPQMAEVAVPLLKLCREKMPEVFGDIEVRECT